MCTCQCTSALAKPASPYADQTRDNNRCVRAQHKREHEYLRRLDNTNHSVRSVVKEFARGRSLLVYSTYYYDCNDDPTWYIIKPIATPIKPPASTYTKRHSIGFCKQYELHASDAKLSAELVELQSNCSVDMQLVESATRLANTDSFPLRCRDDLPGLAAELGLHGAAVEFGNGSGVQFELADAKAARIWSSVARLHKSVEEPMADRNAKKKKKKTTNKATTSTTSTLESDARNNRGAVSQRMRLVLPKSLTGGRAAAVNSHADWAIWLAAETGAGVHRVASVDQVKDGSLDWLHLTDHTPTRKAITADLDAWWPKLRHGGILSGDDFIDRCDERRPLGKSVTFDGAFEDKVVYTQRPIKGGYGVRRAVKDWFGSRVAVPFFVTYMYDCYTEPVWYAIKP